MSLIEPRKKVSEALKSVILNKLNEKFPNSSFLYDDLDRDARSFIARFPKSDIDYLAMCDAGNIPREGLPTQDSTNNIVGKYVRLYVCINSDKPDENMIALDQFEFLPTKNSEEIAVTQLTNEFSGGQPAGMARIYGPTLVINLNFPGTQYPPATFLSSYPRNYAFSVGSVDVQFESSTVIIRPMIFIKVTEFVSCPLTFESGTNIFKIAVKIIKTMTTINSTRLEITPSSEPSFKLVRDFLSQYYKIKQAP
jgi:hypothetical protein